MSANPRDDADPRGGRAKPGDEAAPTPGAESASGPASSGLADFSLVPVWVRRLIPLALVALFTARSLAPVRDPDTWWHVMAGRYVLDHWTFSGPDPFSPFATEPFVLHEWLPEIGLQWLYSVGGLPALAMALPMGVGAVSVALMLVARQRTSLIGAALVTTLALVGMAGGLSIRPQLVSVLLCLVFSATWLASSADLRPRWWLVPLTWMWACSHGFWFVGVLVGVLAVLGAALNGAPWVRVRHLLAVAVASFAAALLTPAGPALLRTPFAVHGITGFITEWQPPQLTAGPGPFVLLLAAVVVVAWARRRTPVDWPSILVFGLAIALLVAYARTVALSAALVTPLAASCLQSLLPVRREALRRGEVLATFGAAVVGVAIAGTLAGGIAGQPDKVPTRLDDALSTLPAGTVVCNEYSLGGWLLFAHPNLVPVVDPRAEVYGAAYLRDYFTWREAGPRWPEYVARQDCGAALVVQDSAISWGLATSTGWQVVGSDRGFTLLEPR